MLVKDLIERLNELPQDMEVMFDATQPNSELFKLVSVDEAEEIECSEGGKYVLLSCGVEHPEVSEN